MFIDNRIEYYPCAIVINFIEIHEFVEHMGLSIYVYTHIYIYTFYTYISAAYINYIKDICIYKQFGNV